MMLKIKMFTGLVGLAAVMAKAGNPIIPDQGVCDPHVRIFGDKAYLFSSHDFGKGEPIYKMVDWQLFSSPDLVNWKKEFVLRPEDTYIGPWTRQDNCYAPDGASRNGKYYFYFSQQQKQNGVAVSDKPEGPYIDVIKKPLLPANLTPTADYDAGILIDDDPTCTPYIVWGFTVNNQDYYIARLNEDMMSLAEKPRKIVIHNGWKNDAPALHKHKGIYYLNSHEGWYATATNVYGPYTSKGQYTKRFADHGSFFTWNNQTYHIYGTREQWKDPFYRTTHITYAHYRDNGDIAVDDFIAGSPIGVGQYDPTWPRIEAEWFFAAVDGVEIRETPGGWEVRGLNEGSWLRYPNVLHLEANASLEFRVAAPRGGGAIEVRQGSRNGALLGTVSVLETGAADRYRTVTVQLKNEPGTQDLCFIFRGQEAAEPMRLDWWRTSQAKVELKP